MTQDQTHFEKPVLRVVSDKNGDAIWEVSYGEETIRTKSGLTANCWLRLFLQAWKR